MATPAWHRLLCVHVSTLAFLSFMVSAAHAQDHPAPPRDAESPWLFDANLGVPKLKSDKFSLSFDVLAGYDFGRWKVDGRVAQSSFAANAAGESLSSTDRSQFLAGVSYDARQGDLSTYAGRVEVEHASYSTMFISTTPGGSFNNEASAMTRLTGFGEGSWALSPKLTTKVSLGVGLQNEVYSQIGTEASNFSAASSMRLAARAGAHYQLVPKQWSLRSTVALDRFELRRTKLFDTEDPDAMSQGPKVEELSGTEFRSRGFLDWDAQTVWGLVPELMVGLDYTSIGQASAWVPMAGVGLVEAR